jgi:hypothetical protein
MYRHARLHPSERLTFAEGYLGFAMFCEQCAEAEKFRWHKGVCETCGRAIYELHMMRDWLRFCSDACRIKAQTARQKEVRHQKRVLYTRDCEYCAQEFDSYRADARTCSAACRVALHRLNRKP